MISNIKIAFSIIYLFLAVACESEKTKDIGKTTEEFAMLHTKYELMLDKSGLEAQVCDACSKKYYQFVSQQMIEGISDEYRKIDVIYEDENAHDFTNIKCKEESRTDSLAVVSCKGKYIVKNKRNQVTEVNNFDRDVIITIQHDRFYYCPPVCINKTK